MVQGQIALQKKVFGRFRATTATLTKRLHITVRGATKSKDKS